MLFALEAISIVCIDQLFARQAVGGRISWNSCEVTARANNESVHRYLTLNVSLFADTTRARTPLGELYTLSSLFSFALFLSFLFPSLSLSPVLRNLLSISSFLLLYLFYPVLSLFFLSSTFFSLILLCSTHTSSLLLATSSLWGLKRANSLDAGAHPVLLFFNNFAHPRRHTHTNTQSAAHFFLHVIWP